MYFVKVKMKDALLPGYASSQIIIYMDQFEAHGHRKKDFLMSYKQAQELVVDNLIPRHHRDFDFEYIAIIRSSHPYLPYGESEVVFYRGFK